MPLWPSSMHGSGSLPCALKQCLRLYNRKRHGCGPLAMKAVMSQARMKPAAACTTFDHGGHGGQTFMCGWCLLCARDDVTVR